MVKKKVGEKVKYVTETLLEVEKVMLDGIQEAFKNKKFFSISNFNVNLSKVESEKIFKAAIKKVSKSVIAAGWKGIDIKISWIKEYGKKKICTFAINLYEK